MFNIPKMPSSPEIRLGSDGKYALDGGINLRRQETALPMNQAADILNVNADDKGTLGKRKGTVTLNKMYPSNDLFPGEITFLDSGLGNGDNVSTIYKSKIIMQWQTFLYSFNLDGSNPIQIYSGLTNSKAFFVVFQGLLYMLNGTEFISYNGTTVVPVVPYIPTVSQGRANNGTTSTLYEPLNFLTGGFTDMFSPDGVSSVFTMSFQGLDASLLTATLNGVAKAETTDFTVDRSTGIVTFITLPPLGTNTLKITAAKTNASDALQIKNCTYAIEFSSRLFITGNPNFPNKLWKTGLTSNQSPLQANYFPQSGLSSFDSITGTDKKMVAFIKKFDKLIYLKENSTHITYNETQADGLSGFPISNINETIGCDMPGSVQLVDNMPIFFNSLNGGYAIASTTILGENEVKPLSICINGNGLRTGLLQESKTDLLNCSSFNDGEKYYLCMPSNSKVYVWDYSLGYNLSNPESLHWFIYDNIHANNFLMINNALCYSSSINGTIVKFIDALNDMGEPIKGVWKSKLMDFGIAEYYKNITDLWLTTRADSDSSITINHFDNDGNKLEVSIVPKSSATSFDLDNIDLDGFIFDVQKFPPTLKFKPGVKGVRYYQIEITNSNFNEDLSIVALVIKWSATKKVK